MTKPRSIVEASLMNPFPIRPFLLAAMGLAALVPGLPAVSARSPAELVPLNPASPNLRERCLEAAHRRHF